ncbi:MAG: crotonobetainyl-CoA hydratase, partial [Actinomycetota bacterium]
MTALVITVVDGVAGVTIDRPKANAIDAATSIEMGEAFLAFEADPAVRVVIVTGAGERFFSAGWDLNAAGGGESFDEDWGAGGFGGFPDLPNRTKPVIAAVNGMAVGGGFEIAMAADLIVAADHAQLFLPEAALGILPDAGSVRLPQLLPAHIAREMLLTGRRMGADEAARWGLVNRVVPGAELLDAAP